MLETFRKLLDLLNPSERRRFYLLLVLVMLMGVAQMFGIAALMPFLIVLAKPEIIETGNHLSWVYHTLGFTETRSFLIFLGAGVFVILVATSLLKTVAQYAVYRFATLRGYTISSRLLRGYLYQPYTWFLNRHSADLGANILEDVQKVIGGGLMPAMKLVSQGAIVLFLVILLVVVNPLAAAVLALLLGGSYSIIYISVRKRLTRIGARRRVANIERFQMSGDAIAGIKDVKVLGLEETYIRRFSRPAKVVAESDAFSAVIGDVPRYVLEAVAFGGMLLFILFLLATGDGTLGGIVPVLGVYAFSAIRLFPALQTVYDSVAAMRFARPTLDKLHEDVMAIRAAIPVGPPAADRPRMHLTDALALEDVHYSYPAAERAALRGLDMTIPARTTVGIVGGTGAGKTTAVDVILGLLPTQRGTLRVDGTAITPENLRAWQNSIGYVPQQIFLTDDSVRANIAFGLPPDQIDDAAVERASRVAELHDFVMTRAAPGLRDRGRRARRAALGRPAPAHRHRPRALPRPRRADPRRGDQRARQPDREGGDGRRAQPRPRQDRHPDRAPPDHGAELRRDLHDRTRQGGRRRDL